MENRCTDCGGSGPYYLNRGKPRSKCKQCEIQATLARRDAKAHAQTNRRWAKKNPEKIREQALKSLYGMSLKDYDVLLAQQKGKCAICDAKNSGPSRKDPLKIEPLFVDHDHASGTVRGLLCRRHNTALGLFSDNIVQLRAAIKYLKKAG